MNTLKRNILSILLCLLCGSAAIAQIPTDYYQQIDGKASYNLKNALHDCIINETSLLYSNLWNYYETTDIKLGTEDQIRDLYSDIVRRFPDHSGMNKEHTVPKSWWGGMLTAQGSDIFHVIPADETANNRKSNLPLGIARNAEWTNGVTTIGPSATPGYTGKVFEPADKYKGDFARMYFYVATRYPNIWTGDAYAMENTDATLKSWIIPMLLDWNDQDPVDDEEVLRNNLVYRVQQNRNPFIDYPELADHIWGEKRAEAFRLSEHTPNTGSGTVVVETKAKAPVFSIEYGTQSAPVAVPEGKEITIQSGNTGEGATLHLKANDGAWQTAQGSATTKPATITLAINRPTHIEAYCTAAGYDKPSRTIHAYYTIADNSQYLLHEDFIDVSAGNNTSTSGSGTPWTGNDNFPQENLVKTFSAGGAVKVGASKTSGSLTSRPIQFAGGTLKVRLDVKGWTKYESPITITLTGAQPQTKDYTALMPDQFETLELRFDNVSPTPTLTISTTNGRAFIDNITVTDPQTSAIQPITIQPNTNPSNTRQTNTHQTNTHQPNTHQPNTHQSNKIQTIDGRTLSQSPQTLSPGLYIMNGKKLLVK